MRFSRYLALVAVLAMVLAACGTDAEPADTTAGGDTTITTEASGGETSGDPIVFGGALPLTGWGSDAGLLNQRGYELWAAQVNEDGGILGRPVELLIYDDQSDPTTTARLYERLISEDEVDVLLAPWSDDMTMPATTVAERAGKPMVTGGATLTDIWDRGYEYVTGLLPSSYDYVGVAIRLVADDVGSVAVVHNDLTYTTGFGDAAVQNVSDLGLDLTAQEAYSEDIQNFVPVMETLGRGNPDLLVGGTGGANDAIQIVQAAKVAGLSPQAMYFTIAPVEPEFVEVLGEDAEYILGTTEWEPSLVDLPGYDRFVDGYREMFDDEPVEDVATAYGLAQILQMAIEEAGGIDDEAINEALHTMEATTVFGEYSVDPDTGMQTGKRIYVLQIQNGERHIVWPEEFATAELIFPMPAWDER